MEIPLSQIAVIDRGRINLGDLAELADDIKSNGQITAGVVRTAVPDDLQRWGVDLAATPYVLVAGGRRIAACALAGIPTFLCIDRGELDAVTQKILELSENLHRKDLEWDEEAAMRKEIHRLYVARAKAKGEKWTLTDTSRITGESIATISRDIALATAIEEDPSLKQAGSKKAAVRVVDMREHLARKEMQDKTSPTGKLQSLLACADARDWLRKVPTASVNLVLTDYPYALGVNNLYKVESDAARPSSEYDDSEAATFDLFSDTVPEVLRITKPEGWICTFMSDSNLGYLQELFESCCVTHFQYGEIIWEQQTTGDWLRHMPTQCTDAAEGEACRFLRAEMPRWIWHRPNSRNPTRHPDLHAKNFYEPLLVLNRGAGKLYKSQDECPNVLVYETEYADRIHIMQKPRSLGRELVQRFTIPGDTVVDPFFGSGNLLAGAAEVQRRIRGCEKNPLLLEQAIVNVAQYYGG